MLGRRRLRWRDARPFGVIEPLLRMHAVLGEGPRWDHRSGRLAWVDILAGLVHLTDGSSGVTTTIPVGHHVGVAALLGTGSAYLLAVGRGFARLDAGGLGPIAPVLDDPAVRMNDGEVDAAGRFLVGTIAYDVTPGRAKLYTRDPSGTVTTLLDSVTISNGIAWSDDGETMYYVDSPTFRIDAFDYDPGTGAISRRRTAITIDEADGCPDGICRDAEGGIWVALWGGSCVRRYRPDGTMTHQIPVPASHVTACVFGGPRLDRLYVTTASVERPGTTDGSTLDGTLFVAEPGFTGVAANLIPETGR
jgi:sugar lactone lactonase YvrE